MRNILNTASEKPKPFTIIAAVVILSTLNAPTFAVTTSNLTRLPSTAHTNSETQRVAKAQKATTVWLTKMSDSRQKKACMKFSTDPSGPFLKKRIFRNAKKYKISKQAAFAPTVKAFNLVCLTRLG